ncbi:hypothetical protein NPIL_100911 [Nephila pilipes]|uniref:Uncharacterized protein n=1 Tax=Nephila pilipes TaxID=299642 RepID=A0A8X6TGA6_NEPPI|nr:hypothetical protein NPIL_100911 [Nephila pilipes]
MFVSGTDAWDFLPPKTAMNGSQYLNLLGEKLELHMIFINVRFPYMIELRVTVTEKQPLRTKAFSEATKYAWCSESSEVCRQCPIRSLSMSHCAQHDYNSD